MSAPEFDKSIYELDSHEGSVALLIFRKDTGMAAVARKVDGDWELNDKGTVDEMRRKYIRLRDDERTKNPALSNPDPKATLQSGMGYDSFDATFPHAEWEQIDAFTTKVGIDYTLWKMRGVRGLNPPAFSSSAFLDPDGEFCWEEVERGPLYRVQESWNKAKASLAYVPPPKVEEYAAHPNFGRF
ncbi:hypothetical protein EVB78_154 [Rhizobium phage RHph_N1_15]|nr:hypothetical protein EVB77_154 [Rhizobium phage RHph_N1_10]QIG69356.1 hypothetical protein EVB78_154 [Rhizobium phage RHph_N1_15]QIG75216.1 hypothetical protein EVC15_154 [Rhizobium phage RHph_N2_6]